MVGEIICKYLIYCWSELNIVDGFNFRSRVKFYYLVNSGCELLIIWYIIIVFVKLVDII